MGIYFNPSNESFKKDSSSRIYIDKTGLIEELNQLVFTAENCVALSHARRFGKSQAAGMLEAYYSYGCDSHELFSQYEIARAADYEEHINKYNVIHIDVSSVADFHKEDLIDTIIKDLKGELADEVDSPINYNQDIQRILKAVATATGRKIVIIIDEWDCIIRNHSDRPDLVHDYLQFLHSLFKSEESKSFLALGYITGILPIKKIKDESALNNFREYTMAKSGEFTRYFGFTEDEVKALCDKYHMEFESVKRWYDGYRINGIDMYNPNSVYSAMVNHELDSYWKNTSYFGTINTYITMNYDGLKDDIMSMLEGKRVRVDTMTFRNDLSDIRSKDDALTALIHLGYLAYSDGMAYIPNYEVAVAYKLALRNSGWDEVAKSIIRCDELLDATIDGNEERVAEIIDLAHEAYTSVLEYNNENSLSCVITMAYFTAPAYYNVIRELPAGKGFADVVMIPRADSNNKPAILVELKYDKGADSAICQILDKRYAGVLNGFAGEVILVGINYDKKTKRHECQIIRLDMI